MSASCDAPRQPHARTQAQKEKEKQLQLIRAES